MSKFFTKSIEVIVQRPIANLFDTHCSESSKFLIQKPMRLPSSENSSKKFLFLIPSSIKSTTGSFQFSLINPSSQLYRFQPNHHYLEFDTASESFTYMLHYDQIENIQLIGFLKQFVAIEEGPNKFRVKCCNVNIVIILWF